MPHTRSAAFGRKGFIRRAGSPPRQRMLFIVNFPAGAACHTTVKACSSLPRAKLSPAFSG